VWRSGLFGIQGERWLHHLLSRRVVTVWPRSRRLLVAPRRSALSGGLFANRTRGCNRAMRVSCAKSSPDLAASHFAAGSSPEEWRIHARSCVETRCRNSASSEWSGSAGIAAAPLDPAGRFKLSEPHMSLRSCHQSRYRVRAKLYLAIMVGQGTFPISKMVSCQGTLRVNAG